MNDAFAVTGAAGVLLALWERAAGVAPADRDDALLAAAEGDPPTSLGARNAALMGLRSRLFGRVQPLRCNCPHCGAVSEFPIDCDALAQALQPAPEAARMHQMEAAGWRVEFRLPNATDVRVVSEHARDEEEFVLALLQRCVSRCERDDGATCAPQELPAAVAEALSRRMEALEGGASVSFELHCPECALSWAAFMDVGAVLWSELQSRAERLLLDVDVLARAYGWSEAQVLALSPTRRAAYLQLVGAG